jgi:phosphinothricin acetyltransferase
MTTVIRLATPADAEGIAEVYRPYVEDSRISFEDVAPRPEEMARRLIGETPGLYPWLVVNGDGRIAGFATSSPFRTRRAYRWSVETGIYLAPEACGRGTGRELLSTLLQLLTRQGFVSAVGAIALPNEPSVRLHETLGFANSGTYRQVGFKFGEWIDVGLWQCDLAPRVDVQPEPIAFDGLTVGAGSSTAGARLRSGSSPVLPRQR